MVTRGYLHAAILFCVILLTTGLAEATIYVSLTGDNSDGSSWQKAFTTVQQGIGRA